MSAEGSHPDLAKLHSPQDAGFKDSRTFTDRLANGEIRDELGERVGKILDDKSTRRRVVGGGAVLGIASAVGLDRLFRRGHDNSPPQSTVHPENITPPEKLENELKFLHMDDEHHLSFSDVAEYFEAEFSRVAHSPENPQGDVVIRNEYKSWSQKAEFVDPELLNDRGIVLIRVASKHDNLRPEYSFVMKEPIPQDPDNEQRYYEWFALAVPTNDPDHPLQYVDYQGNASEQPWFVGPNFVSSKS